MLRQESLTPLSILHPALPDHYAALGLDRDCTDAQIRAAYRLLAKQHHPDVNGSSPAASVQTQALNAAYEVLSDPVLRRQHDRELAARQKRNGRTSQVMLNVTREVQLRIEDFFRGTKLEVRVNEPGNPNGPERYELSVPPATAPGTRFRIPRDGSAAGGFVIVRVKAQPDFRFKVRGSDLRCDLKINSQRALQGGNEIIRSATGTSLRIQIPPKVKRGEIISLPGEGLPKARGGRGTLQVRVLYAPTVQIRRAAHQ